MGATRTVMTWYPVPSVHDRSLWDLRTDPFSALAPISVLGFSVGMLRSAHQKGWWFTGLK